MKKKILLFIIFLNLTHLTSNPDCKNRNWWAQAELLYWSSKKNNNYIPFATSAKRVDTKAKTTRLRQKKASSGTEVKIKLKTKEGNKKGSYLIYEPEYFTKQQKMLEKHNLCCIIN